MSYKQNPRAVLSRLDPVQRPSPGNRHFLVSFQVKSDTIVLWLCIYLYYNISNCIYIYIHIIYVCIHYVYILIHYIYIYISGVGFPAGFDNPFKFSIQTHSDIFEGRPVVFVIHL